MINNNYNRLVNSFGMVEDMALDIVGRSLNMYVRQCVRLSVYPSSNKL